MMVFAQIKFKRIVTLILILAGASIVLRMVRAESFNARQLNSLTPAHTDIPYQDLPYCSDTELAEDIYGEMPSALPPVSVSIPLDGCKLKLESLEVSPDEIDELALPISPIRISENSEIVVQIPPCMTPTPPADYRGLLPPGTIICGNSACIQGYEMTGKASPTRFPGQPDFLEVNNAIIIYQSNGECTQNIISP